MFKKYNTSFFYIELEGITYMSLSLYGQGSNLEAFQNDFWLPPKQLRRQLGKQKDFNLSQNGLLKLSRD